MPPGTLSTDRGTDKKGCFFYAGKRKTVSEPAAVVCAGQGQDHVSV